MADALIFLIFNLVILLLIYFIDRKELRTHIELGFAALIAVIAFEIFPILAGFWMYYAQPKIWIYSVYIFLLYFPFISISYFAANKVFKIKWD